jgi:hypothetical protein
MFYSRKRVLIARVLLLIMVFQTFPISIIPAARADEPVSDHLKSYVNLFTGDFFYSIPLMTVTGPNGESVPVSLSYSAGIRNEQEASWAGLGWDLNPGEITRSVKGMPDDYRADLSYFVELSNGGSSGTMDYSSNYFGPVHFDEYNTVTPAEPEYLKGMDTYKSNRFMEKTNKVFIFPDYDNYFVSGPGIAGQMSLHLFEYKTLMNTEFNSGIVNRFPSTKNPFTKKPRFIFREENAPQAIADFDQIGSWASVPKNSFGTTNDTIFRFPHTFTGFAYKGVNSYNRPNSGNYVEYFTNEQLSSSLPAGFLDYKSPASVRSSASGHPPQSIGAFRVTDTRGYTYHYSLPVYSFNEANYSFSLDSTGNFNLTGGKINLFIRNPKYPASWKLTAITGTDYVDANSNHLADPGDKGYWVSYDYGLWTDDFTWQSPFYGFGNDLAGSVIPPIAGTTVKQETYRKSGSIARGHTRKYYLNSIRTATHTAYFIKDIREDGHSKNISSSVAARKFIPELFLRKIVLVRTEDATLSPNSTDVMVNPFVKYDLSACHPENVLHTANYEALKAQIDQASLRTVELGFDYSLSPGVFNNVRNSFSPGTPYYQNVQDNGSFYLYENAGTASAASGGRLTLKSVKMLERGYVQVFPDYELSYSKNPAYTHNAQDVWGFYKSDYSANPDGIYTGPVSKENVDAWSLTGIVTPVGSRINIEYESDRYEKAGNTTGGKPQRIFLIKGDTRTKVNGDRMHKLEFRDKDIQEFLEDGMQDISFMIPYETLPDNDSCNAEIGCVYGTDPFYEYNIHSYSTGPAPGSYTHFTYNPSDNSISGLSLQKCACYLNCPYPVESYDPSRVLAYAYITPRVAYGGGIRVKSLSIRENETARVYRTELSYSGGFATTEPDRFSIADFKKLSRYNVSGDRHTVSPTVGYSVVTAKNKGANGAANGYTEYAYRNYNESFLPEYNEYAAILQVNGNNINHYYEGVAVEEDNSLYGKLLSEKVFDNNGNMLMQIFNEYSEPNDVITGKVDEVFNCNTVSAEAHSANYAKRVVERVLVKTTTVRDNIPATTLIYESSIDTITGKARKVNVTDLSRASRDRISVPAFDYAAQMGSKAADPSNRNILQPSAKEVLRGVNGVFETGTRSIWDNAYEHRTFNSSTGKYVTQASTGGGYWYPRKTTVFDGVEHDSTWKTLTQITLLDDINKRVLEQREVKRYSASKYGYRNLYRIAEVKNANYLSFAFSSFEDQLTVGSSPSVIHFGGEVRGGEKRIAATSVIPAHTGDYLLKLAPNESGGEFRSEVNNQSSGSGVLEKGLQTGRIYRASVWVHRLSSPGAQLIATLTGTLSGGGAVNDTYVRQKDDPANTAAGDWVLMTLDIEAPAALDNNSSLSVYLKNPSSYVPFTTIDQDQTIVLPPVANLTDAWFDDLNFHPVDAPIAGYVYDEKTGWIKAVLDNENFATFYEYDPAGRVILTKKETVQGIRNVSSTIYHNAR